MTQRSELGSTSSSSGILPSAVTLWMASSSVVPLAFVISRNCLLTSWIISAAAFPTDIIVKAAKKNGSMAPMRVPAKRIGSKISKFSLLSFVTSCLKAARSDSAVRTAEPTAKPLPIAAVVLPNASSESVLARTSGPRPAISAKPPALSATGPYASVESDTARVPSIPTAAKAIPYWFARALHATMHPTRMSVGRIVLTIPTPIPWMMTVAGPVLARSLMDLVGP
mmetsp:Transcript_112859/g.224590  ORF Transcript_112859/g.224590 Transcript_112859/m.224590 type:complete len:225 (+) Transcript_112859:656-1330(+)